MGTQAPWKERLLGLCGGGEEGGGGERVALLSSFAHSVPAYKISGSEFTQVGNDPNLILLG